MATELRDTGISAVGEIPWGTHFCLFYETKQDLLDLLIPYFKAGLENHEFCLCIASEPVIAQEAERALREAVPDLNRYLAEGQIEIISHQHWYLADGHFDPLRVRQGWISKLEQGLARGYEGMRFAANVFRLEKEDWESFADYEGKLDEVFGKLRILAVCAYAVARCSAANMLDVVRHHQFSVARRHGAWERLEGPELLRAHAEIRKLNTDLERRVAERTQDLIAMNNELRREITRRQQSEEALRASEARLQAAIDAADLGLWDYDLVSGQLVWLGHLEKLFGFAPGEFDGTLRDFERRVHPEDLEELNSIVRRAREERSEYAHEYRVICPDGSIHWIGAKGRFINDETGQPVRMYGAVHDITERKQVEQALRKSERVLREAESLGHTGSWEHDLVTGEIFNTEENLRLFFGDDRSKGTPFEDYAQAVHPDDREYVVQRHAQLLAEGGPGDIEFRVVWPDGSVHVLFGCATVVRDESGQPVRVYGTNLDITERKRAEEEVKRQATRAETLARIAARLNKQLDLDAVIQAVCQEAVDTFKVSQATMSLYDEKRDLLVYVGGVNIPPEYAATIEPIARSRFDDFLRTLGPIMVVPDIQSMADVPNAEFSSHLDVRTVVTAAMLRDRELIGVLVLGVNGHVREFAKDELTLLKAISDQAAQAIANAKLFKAANEQSVQLRILSTKLVEAQETERRAIARELHDQIGQVLTAVSVNLQAIQLSPDASTLAARLDDSLALMDDALSRVRDLSLDLRPSMLDDFGLVSALEWYLERQAQRSEFEAEFVAEPPEMRLPPSLETTVFRVAQIALANVVRHAQAKHVWVALHRHEEGIELVIRDDGVGFDVPSALESAAHGATLGLLSMQERARLARGELEILSRPGQGTEIRARFPLS
jgi:PAS domain S-box-containing protein